MSVSLNLMPYSLPCRQMLLCLILDNLIIGLSSASPRLGPLPPLSPSLLLDALFKYKPTSPESTLLTASLIGLSHPGLLHTCPNHPKLGVTHPRPVLLPQSPLKLLQLANLKPAHPASPIPSFSLFHPKLIYSVLLSHSPLFFFFVALVTICTYLFICL